MTPSTAKNGTLSCIVPFITHVDHTEHDIHFLVTEYGYADLRATTPKERARKIIDTCAHPDFRLMLHDYLDRACAQCAHKHTPQLLGEVFQENKLHLPKKRYGAKAPYLFIRTVGFFTQIRPDCSGTGNTAFPRCGNSPPR